MSRDILTILERDLISEENDWHRVAYSLEDLVLFLTREVTFGDNRKVTLGYDCYIKILFSLSRQAKRTMGIGCYKEKMNKADINSALLE